MSILEQQFFHEKGVNWWLIPPESPDCNPIENLWHELKEHLRREVKPRNKEYLIQGIVTLWETVDVTKYCKYINHLAEVLPKLFECEGGHTGYSTFTVCVIVKLSPNACTHGYRYGRPTTTRTEIRQMHKWASEANRYWRPDRFEMGVQFP